MLMIIDYGDEITNDYYYEMNYDEVIEIIYV